MIKGLHQRHYKNAIINVLEAWGGEAYGRDVIDALMNGPNEFRIELTAEITHLSTLAVLRQSS